MAPLQDNFVLVVAAKLGKNFAAYLAVTPNILNV